MLERNIEITSDDPPTNAEVLQIVTDVPRGEYTLLGSEQVIIIWATKCLLSVCGVCVCVVVMRECESATAELRNMSHATEIVAAITAALFPSHRG